MNISTIPDLLINAQEKYANNIALISHKKSLTYSKLYELSLQLSALLVDQNVSKSDRIIICLPKCQELTIAIFGSLFTGATYVPIDYSTPVDRAALIIEDVEPKAIICTAKLLGQLFPNSSEDIKNQNGVSNGFQAFICFFNKNFNQPFQSDYIASWDNILNFKPLVKIKKLSPSENSYILFTSGSTGRPKGVLHTHLSALTFIKWASLHLKITSSDIMSQHASPSFDLTVFDFYCSVMNGATLVSIPEWMFGRISRIYKFIIESKITIWYSVPSALLHPDHTESFKMLSNSSLRAVVFAGEVIPKNLLIKFCEYLPKGCTVSNWYGPTETNVCTFHDITEDDFVTEQSIPIGKTCPYATAKFETPELLEEGEILKSQLLINSPTVMKGYWRKKNLTDLTMVEDSKGDRYYKTGDNVIFDNNKMIFIGRNDRLLKVGGFRIQPEEIEIVLSSKKEIIEAVVVTRKKGGKEILVAAIISEEKINNTELKRYCAIKLPSYMIPSLIVNIKTMPRDKRGKVDVNAVKNLIEEKELSVE